MEEPLAILFDIDGTLISTGGAGSRSWRWAFERLFAVPADIARFSEVGMTDPQVARSVFSALLRRAPEDKELGRLLAAYLDRLPTEVEGSAEYRILGGVEELLPRLCRTGFLLGITTGTIEAAAHIKLARSDLNRFFCFGGYGSDSDDRAGLTGVAIQRAGRILGRPLDPRQVVVVGDTPLDIEAARSNGAISVGVATGNYGEGELKEAGADHVLASLGDPLPFASEWERVQGRS
ncbi:MAG: HAD family hydrolase [Actinomycetota bacterium]